MNPYNMKLESVYAKGEDGEFHLVARRDECETTATDEREYIEREKVENWLLTESASLDTEVDREYVVERLRSEIPSADVRPVVRGRWIKYAPHNSDMMTCSECEKYWILDGDQYDYHYCPNCGADMREES